MPLLSERFNNRAHRIGVRVKDTKRETKVTMTMVTAKGRKKRPIMLPMPMMGNNTTMFVPALARTANATSCEPADAASRALMPSEKRFVMLSSTTIELVTRMPTESPSASRVDVFSVYSRYCRKNRLMIIVKGIVIATMSVVRMLYRNKNRIIAVSRTPWKVLDMALSTLDSMNPPSSLTQTSSMPPGRSAFKPSTASRTRSTTRTALASAFLTTRTPMQGEPSTKAVWRSSALAMDTEATSPRYTRAPLRLAISSVASSPTVSYSASNFTLNSRPLSRTRPDGMVRTLP